MSLPSYVRSDFAVYDGRQHVLGASMLAGMDKFLRERNDRDTRAPFHVKRAKFMRKTGCNGLLYASLDGARAERIEDVAAHVVGRLGDQTAEVWFVPDEESPVKRGRPSAHDIAEITPAGDFAGSCRIRADGLESVLCTLVDANKLVQLAGEGVRQTFGEKRPVTELVYIEDLAIEVSLARLDTTVTLETLGVREGGGRLYTLNRIRFTDDEGNARTCRLGFSFETKCAGRHA